MLPKIHKRLYDVPGRPVTFNGGFYTENISSFLDFHLQPLAQKVKSYIKDTNHFLRKIKESGQLPEGSILCTTDVVGLYPNIPHGEGLAFLKDFLDSRVDKQVTTDTVIELAEPVLKNTIFEISDKTYKQIHRTAIGTKFDPPHAVLFMAALEEKILSKVKRNRVLGEGILTAYFFFGNMVKNLLKNLSMRLIHFIQLSNLWQTGQKKKVNFLDVEVTLKNGVLSTNLFVKPTDTHQFLDPASCHPYHCKKDIPYSQTLRLNRICSNNSQCLK